MALGRRVGASRAAAKKTCHFAAKHGLLGLDSVVGSKQGHRSIEGYGKRMELSRSEGEKWRSRDIAPKRG